MKIIPNPTHVELTNALNKYIFPIHPESSSMRKPSDYTLVSILLGILKNIMEFEREATEPGGVHCPLYFRSRCYDRSWAFFC
jgi:hypothetical protein